MQDTTTVSKKVNSQNRSSFLIKTYDHIFQLENAIKTDKEIAAFKLNFTMLVKLSEAHFEDESYKLNLKKRINRKATTAVFNNPNVGEIYSVGILTTMFMQIVGNKVLGSLDGGIYGILRGLDIDEECAANCIEKLKEGKYMLITSGDPQDITRLMDRLGNNCQD